MTFPIIPEPQYCSIYPGLLNFSAKKLAVTLWVPVPDDRLLKPAQKLFASASYSTSSSPLYAITTEEGDLPNPAAAKRLEGRIDGYVLSIEEKSLQLCATSASGLFYGIKTLETLFLLYPNGIPCSTVVDWANVKLRTDHLDLRTVYPPFEHILDNIRLLSKYKLNGLVIEYEDKLPFQTLPKLRHAHESFSEKQLQEILQTAYDNFIEIIPLQQTFGHLEYVLKHPEYIHLRETPENVGELCPLRPGAYEIACKLIEEIARLHPNSRFLHIGCDEVWSLGSSPECIASGKSKEEIFIDFVNLLCEKVLSLGKIPLMWHDMLESCPVSLLKKLNPEIRVVVWIYKGGNLKSFAKEIIHKFQAAGLQVFGASAVRCGDMDTVQNYPVLENRLRNVTLWNEIVEEEQMECLINTNWASEFSLGVPYGVYETTQYPLFFAAERSWNFRSSTKTFLNRYLIQFHQVPLDFKIDPGFNETDYFRVVPNILDKIQLHQTIAQYISLMVEYERYTKHHFPAHLYIYRIQLLGRKEEELTSLKTKYLFTYQKLNELRPKIAQIMDSLLSPSMAKLFVESRYFLYGLYEREILNLLKETAEHDL